MKRIIVYILLLFTFFGCAGVDETVSHQNDDVYFANKEPNTDTTDTNVSKDKEKVDYYDKETAEQLEYERLMRRNEREWLYNNDIYYYNNDTYWRIRGTLIEDEEYYDPTNDTYQPNDNSSGSYDDDKDKRDREIDGSNNKRRR